MCHKILDQRQPVFQLAWPLCRVKPRWFTLNQGSRKLNTGGVTCTGLIGCPGLEQISSDWNENLATIPKKTCLLSYSELMRSPYLSNFKPEVARIVFRARVGVYDVKDNFMSGDLNCPFCRQLRENFEHIVQCNWWIFCRRSLKGTTLFELATMKDTQNPERIGEFLAKYQKYREFFCEKIVLWLLA